MKIISAEIKFENYKVEYCGYWIVVRVFDYGRWVKIHEFENKWQGKGKENKGVNSRLWKVNLTDAIQIVRMAKEKQSKKRCPSPKS